MNFEGKTIAKLEIVGAEVLIEFSDGTKATICACTDGFGEVNMEIEDPDTQSIYGVPPND